MAEPHAFSKSRYWTCRYSAASAGQDDFGSGSRQEGLAEAYDCENQGIINISLHFGEFPLYKIRQPDRTFKMVAKLHHVQVQDTPGTVDKSLEGICANCQFYQPKHPKSDKAE